MALSRENDTAASSATKAAAAPIIIKDTVLETEPFNNILDFSTLDTKKQRPDGRVGEYTSNNMLGDIPGTPKISIIKADGSKIFWLPEKMPENGLTSALMLHGLDRDEFLNWATGLYQLIGAGSPAYENKTRQIAELDTQLKEEKITPEEYATQKKKAEDMYANIIQIHDDMRTKLQSLGITEAELVAWEKDTAAKDKINGKVIHPAMRTLIEKFPNNNPAALLANSILAEIQRHTVLPIPIILNCFCQSGVLGGLANIFSAFMNGTDREHSIFTAGPTGANIYLDKLNQPTRIDVTNHSSLRLRSTDPKSRDSTEIAAVTISYSADLKTGNIIDNKVNWEITTNDPRLRMIADLPETSQKTPENTTEYFIATHNMVSTNGNFSETLRNLATSGNALAFRQLLINLKQQIDDIPTGTTQEVRENIKSLCTSPEMTTVMELLKDSNMSKFVDTPELITCVQQIFALNSLAVSSKLKKGDDPSPFSTELFNKLSRSYKHLTNELGRPPENNLENKNPGKYYMDMTNELAAILKNKQQIQAPAAQPSKTGIFDSFSQQVKLRTGAAPAEIKRPATPTPEQPAKPGVKATGPEKKS